MESRNSRVAWLMSRARVMPVAFCKRNVNVGVWAAQRNATATLLHYKRRAYCCRSAEIRVLTGFSGQECRDIRCFVIGGVHGQKVHGQACHIR